MTSPRILYHLEVESRGSRGLLLVGRTAPADSEPEGLLRFSWEHGRAIAETIEGSAGD